MEIGIDKKENILKVKLVVSLQFDFTGLEYISSAGLRVLLSASKRMKKQGKMEIYHANEEVMEVFTITGFADILTIL